MAAPKVPASPLFHQNGHAAKIYTALTIAVIVDAASPTPIATMLVASKQGVMRLLVNIATMHLETR